MSSPFVSLGAESCSSASSPPSPLTLCALAERYVAAGERRFASGVVYLRYQAQI